MTNSRTISPSALHGRLLAGEELAIIDVREQGVFGEGHLLIASNLPLGELEIRARALMPRLSVPVVICDAADGSATAACSMMELGGYNDVQVLEGGVQAWAAAGYELFSGINVPSKAFGEYVEHHFETPRIEASELQRRIDAGEKFVILDTRPFDEFELMSIPNGIDTPGAELVYRVHDLAPDSTPIIVNCAGRTRSIIGCQSLLNAGVSNPVMALKDGTMGWHLAGLEVARGSQTRYGSVSDEAREWSSVAADRVAERFGVRCITCDQLQKWQAEATQKTLYVFDVRQADEFAAGHLPGSVHAAGGQLVQATDVYVAVRAARIVLVDDTSVRAKMTASWLNQMGFENVAVLEGGSPGTDTTTARVTVDALVPVPDIAAVTAPALADDTEAVVVDIRRSLLYRNSHVRGAFWGGRSSLEDWGHKLPAAAHYVVVADEVDLACFFGRELCDLTGKRVSRLIGGMADWLGAGFDAESGWTRGLGEPTDVFHRPYDRESGREAAMQAYLDWEVALLEQVKRDATVQFPKFSEGLNDAEDNCAAAT